MELLEMPGPARVGGGLGGEGGGSGRRKSEAAGVEMRRGGPRGHRPGCEEERKGGHHGHHGRMAPAAACYGGRGFNQAGLGFGRRVFKTLNGVQNFFDSSKYTLIAHN
jgi:hypothetical protein